MTPNAAKVPVGLWINARTHMKILTQRDRTNDTKRCQSTRWPLDTRASGWTNERAPNDADDAQLPGSCRWVRWQVCLLAGLLVLLPALSTTGRSPSIMVLV